MATIDVPIYAAKESCRNIQTDVLHEFRPADLIGLFFVRHRQHRP